MAESHRGKKHRVNNSPEARQRRSDATKLRWANGFKGNTGRKRSKQAKEASI